MKTKKKTLQSKLKKRLYVAPADKIEKLEVFAGYGNRE